MSEQPQGTHKQPPQPPAGGSSGRLLKIGGIGCAGIIGLFILIAIITAVAGGGDDGERTTTTQGSNDTEDIAAAEEEETPTAAAQEELRTATTEPTEEAIATPEPTATAEPSPTPTPDLGTPEVAVTGYQVYEASYGGTSYIMGFAENTGDGDADQVQIVASLYGDGGAIVASEGSYEHFSYIPAGGFTPFMIIVNQVPGAWLEEQFQVQFETAGTSIFAIGRDYFEFEVVQANWSGGEYENQVVGEIVNAGDQTASSVMVMVAGFGQEGEFLFSGSAYLDLEQVASDMQVPFSASIRAGYAGPDPARIEVVAGGYTKN